MPLTARTISALAATAMLAGCSSTPTLYPRVIRHGEPVENEFWLRAPYVGVVRILDRKIRTSSFDSVRPGEHLVLVQYIAEVEDVIKGDLPTGRLSFFMFIDPFQRPDYSMDSGGLYIVFLRRESGVLRSWTDVTQIEPRLFSGAHAQSALPLDGGPGSVIAYLLITPGSKRDAKRYNVGFAAQEARNYTRSVRLLTS